MKEMTLVIMAAGMGSRFGGLKQIEPVGPNGEFIIDYSIYDARRAGFDKVVFIIKKENYDVFKETIGSRIDKYIDVSYVFQTNDNINVSIPMERVKPFGTAHAIMCAKDVVKENFAIINADDFYGFDAYLKVGEYLKNNDNINEYSLVGYNVKDTITNNGSVKRGVCEIENGYLTKLTESVISYNEGKLCGVTLESNDVINVDDDTTVSMNMFGFTPKLFEYLESGFSDFLNSHDLNTCEYLIPSAVNEYLERGMVSVKVLNTTSKWFGITYREDMDIFKRELNKLIDEGVYPRSLWD